MVSSCRLIVMFALAVCAMSQTRGGKKMRLPFHRDKIKAENPEKYYNFGNVIGKGKLSYVKDATERTTNKRYAAKIIHFSDDTKFAEREYDNMVAMAKQGLGPKQGFPMLHEAYLVRHYLIIIMDLCEGSSLLQYAKDISHVRTEDNVRSLVKRLVEILGELHAKKIAHLDVRPSNIRLMDNEISGMRLLDYNSAQALGTSLVTVDVFGDTEFTAPEAMSFDKVSTASDMFVVGEMAFVLLTGKSPFFSEDELRIDRVVQQSKWTFPQSADHLTSEAKDFVKKLLIRSPEFRLTAHQALEHKWLSSSKNTFTGVQLPKGYWKSLDKTDERLRKEEEKEYAHASFVFHTFDEPDTEEEEDDDDDDAEDERLYKEEPHEKPVLPEKPLPLLTASGVLAVGGIVSLLLLAVIWRRRGVVHYRPVAPDGQQGLE